MTAIGKIISAAVAAALSLPLLSGCGLVNELSDRLDRLENQQITSAAVTTDAAAAETTSEPVGTELAASAPDLDWLIASNRLPDVLADGRIIKATLDVFDIPTYYEYYVLKDRDFAILTERNGYSGFYRGLQFSADPDTGKILFTSYYLDEYAEAVKENYATHISGVLRAYENAEVVSFDESSAHVYGKIDETDGETNWSYELNADFSLPDGMASRIITEQLFEGNTYRSAVEYRLVSESDIPGALLDYLNAFDGEKKQVTYGFFRDGNLVKETFTVPYDWEYQVYADDSWSDETCSTPYEYPGDGIDYTVIYNPAKG